MSFTHEQIKSYTYGWTGKPTAQVAEEIASLSMETKRIPDPYSFYYNNYGKLISPETGRLIENSIDKISPLGNLEYQGYKLVEELGWKFKKGTIVWLSPPHPDRPVGSKFYSKIIVTNILDNPKGLFNRAFVLDLDLEGCKQMANNLELDYLYTSETQLRKRPIYISENFDFSLLPDKRQVEMVASGNDIRAKNEALMVGRIAAKDISQLNKIQEEHRIFGDAAPSCAPKAFEVFATDIYGSLHFPCDRCLQTNIRQPLHLIENCQICGGKVRCK